MWIHPFFVWFCRSVCSSFMCSNSCSKMKFSYGKFIQTKHFHQMSKHWCWQGLYAQIYPVSRYGFFFEICVVNSVFYLGKIDFSFSLQVCVYLLILWCCSPTWTDQRVIVLYLCFFVGLWSPEQFICFNLMVFLCNLFDRNFIQISSMLAYSISKL